MLIKVPQDAINLFAEVGVAWNARVMLTNTKLHYKRSKQKTSKHAWSSMRALRLRT